LRFYPSLIMILPLFFNSVILPLRFQHKLFTSGIIKRGIVFLSLHRSLIMILPLFFNSVILPLRFQNEGVGCSWDITPIAFI
jgi:hypothetical protein